jgi:hypothetical protein
VFVCYHPLSRTVVLIGYLFRKKAFRKCTFSLSLTGMRLPKPWFGLGSSGEMWAELTLVFRSGLGCAASSQLDQYDTAQVNGDAGGHTFDEVRIFCPCPMPATTHVWLRPSLCLKHMLRYALICSVKPTWAERVCLLKSGLFLTVSLMFMFVAANVSDAA